MKSVLQPAVRWLRKRTLHADLIQLAREKQAALDALRERERAEREIIARAHQREAEIRDELATLDGEATPGEWIRFVLFLAVMVPLFAVAVMVTT
jgi:hypothetical protein